MAEPQRPILIIPRGMATGFNRRSPFARNQDRPSKGRAVARVGPKFRVLQEALNARRAELRANASGVSPEQVVVFETSEAGAKPFLDALASIPQLAWLVETEGEGVEPDDLYSSTEEAGRPRSTRLFLIMANFAALDQLVSLWHRWTHSRRAKLGKHKAWATAFRHLSDVRLWGPRDRIADTGLLEEWEQRKNSPYPEMVPVEVELWHRSSPARSQASARVRAHVQASDGEVIDERVIPEIAYHALLIRMPIAAVDKMLRDPTVALIKSDDVHLLRPVPQQPWFSGRELSEDEWADAPSSIHPRDAEPTVALLDGLPLQRHVLLRDRLVVDDPDGWEADYPANRRVHGTAMASLILHGDRSGDGEPSPRPIYVRPILRPADFGRREEPPRDRLWIDVIHSAVLRIVGTDRTSAAAPEVRVINLSIGDLYRPFLREISPLARLLDWLAWQHRVLFVVSAGNHGRLLVADESSAIDQRTLRAMQAAHGHRRLLSPAESINSLTVGAQHADLGGPWEPRSNDEVTLLTVDSLPSPISALGRGVQRSVKPELLAPGGRVVFVRDVEDPCAFQPCGDRARLGPGQRAAAPGRAGALDAEEFSIVTSNAAALTSRAAMQILENVRQLRGRAPGTFGLTDEALLVKALLVHTSMWDAQAVEQVRAALSPNYDRGFRDWITGFLGYGCIAVDRALGCELHRVTLVGGGEIKLDGAVQHRIPLPPSLHTYSGFRRLVVTLAWFSPVSPSHRKYRIAALEAVVNEAKRQLLMDSSNADWNSARRGTVQHQVYEGRTASALRIAEHDELSVTINGWSEISGHEGTPVPYTLAVTLEIDATTQIRIYEDIAARIGSAIRVGT